MSNKPKVLITGGTGFVGKYLERHLSGKSEVYVSSRSKNYNNVIQLELMNLEKSKKIFEEYRFEKIFHLTSQSSVQLSLKRPFETIYDNINTTVNLLNIIHSLKLNSKIVLASTSEIYAASETSLKETSALKPRNPYAISKIVTDYLVNNLSKEEHLNVTLLRLFNHTGPGQTDNFVLASFSKQLAEMALGMRDPVIEVGNLQAERDFIDVRDVCEAYDLVSNEIDTGEAYNVCSGKGYKIEDLLNKLIEKSGLNVEVKVEKSRLRPIEIPRIVGDYSKIKERFGWEPEVTIDQTLSDMYDWWLENLQN